MMTRARMLASAILLAAIGICSAPGANTPHDDIPADNFPYTISKCVGTPIAGFSGVQFDRVTAVKHAVRELREHDNRGIIASRIWNFLVRRSRIKYYGFIEEQCRLRAAGKDYQFNVCHPEFESLESILASAPGDIYTWTSKALGERYRAVTAQAKAAYLTAKAACNP